MSWLRPFYWTTNVITYSLSDAPPTFQSLPKFRYFSQCSSQLLAEAMNLSHYKWQNNKMSSQDHCEWNWVVKSLSWRYVKSYDCFLTHWLPMASILVLIGTFKRNQLRCNYVRNEKKFFQSFSAFLTSSSNFKNFEKNDDSHGLCISDIPDCKRRGYWNDWNPASEDPSTSNMVNGPKHIWNLHDSSLIRCIDHCQGNWVEKILSLWYVKS